MANHRLGGGPRHAVRDLTQSGARAPRLDRVVQLRRGAVIVDVADLLRRASGLRQRGAHAAHDLGAIGIHLHAVIGITGRGVAFDAGIDARAPGPRAILALEREHPGAFAEHEAVAAAIERAGGLRRAIVVAGGHRAHAREPEHHARQHAAVGAARQQDVVLVEQQEHAGIAHRVGGAGAAGGEDVADAVQPERDRNLARHHAADAERDGVGRDVTAVVGEEVLVLLLADVDAAAARADDHAGAGLAEAEAGVIPRLARGPNAEHRGP